MTDHHDHHHGDQEQGAHGVPLPPSDDELRSFEEIGVRGAEMVPLHFFEAPSAKNLPTTITPRRVRLRDGTYQRCTREYQWFLDRVEGTTKARALTKIYDVLLHPRSWIRSGVHWKRVMDPAQAQVLVRVIPQDTTVCGPGAAGCYSWGGGRPPAAEMGVEYIDRPGPFAALTNMELLGHGTFKADDMYFAVHLPYAGVMGTWEAMARAGYYPTDQEVADTVAWMEGRIPGDRIHWH